MITPEKVEEWLKEVEQRPTSAAIIIQYISNRLRDLSSRNEALLAENIALLSGKKVEEYERRISHLEYQLELLKRQLSGEQLAAAEEQVLAGEAPEAKPRLQSTQIINLLVYHSQGRVLRLGLHPERLQNGMTLGFLRGELMQGDEAPHLVIAPEAEELLFTFSSGRVATLPVAHLSLAKIAGDLLDWEHTPIPDEPRAGEMLACLTPISRLALAEFFLQASRRGLVKKIKTSMAQSILINHYIGTGIKQAPDRLFRVLLSEKGERLALVSREGFLLCLDARGLPYSLEEAMRLAVTDHLVEAFTIGEGQSVLVMTQTGKIIQLSDENIETAQNLKVKGQAIFSQQRREKGVRVAGAAGVMMTDWVVTLHRNGQVMVHTVRALLDEGVLPVQGELLSLAILSQGK